MKDPAASSRKKIEIKLQMGKRKRKRSKKGPVSVGKQDGANDPLLLAPAAVVVVESLDIDAGRSSASDAGCSIPSPGDEWEEPDLRPDDCELPLANAEHLQPKEIIVKKAIPERQPTPEVSLQRIAKPRPQSDQNIFPINISPGDTCTQLVPYQTLDPWLVSTIPFRSLREVTLLKYYIYDVCAYTYRGMAANSLSEVIRSALIPHCQRNKTFLYGCVGGGLRHLYNAARNNGQDVRKLETEITKNNLLVFRRLVTELKSAESSRGAFGTIMCLLNNEVCPGHHITSKTHTPR